MNSDLGLLVDFLRGELDSASAAAVRSRLEDDADFFSLFQRLKRTYQVIRSMPSVRPASQAHAEVPSLPLTTPREQFVADLHREFEARDWMSLLPWIDGREEFLRGLRVEFSVRAILNSLPQLVPGESFVNALRAEFGVRARVASLPALAVRAEWVRALREEFAVRGIVSCLPLLEPRPEFVADLRREFVTRALAASVPTMEVRAGFERRLQVALFEAGPAAAVAESAAETAAETAAAAPALPVVDADDPFRRRLFKKILLSSRRRVREEPRRVDVAEYQFGREFKRGLRNSRRSVGLTMGLHALAIALMLFVFATPPSGQVSPQVMRASGESILLPEMPGSEVTGETQLRQPDNIGLDEAGWSSAGEETTVGLGSDRPATDLANERTTQDTPALDPRERQVPDADLGETGNRSNVSSFFRLRNAPRSEKIDYLGSEELYEALDRALRYLQRTQRGDGSWWLVEADVATVLPGHREVQEIEITSAALLAFLGDGHTSFESAVNYDFNVRRGIQWLISRQREDGQIGPPELGNVMVHAMATLVLAEEFGLTRAHYLREPLRRACRWLCAVEARESAGFPFLLGQEASLTTSVWAYMALATARDVRVPPIDLPEQRVKAFLDWFEGTSSSTTALPENDLVLTKSDLLPSAAAGALNLFAGEGRSRNAGLFLRRINRNLPDLRPDINEDQNDVRYLFFGSLAQAMNVQRGGSPSVDWNQAFVRTLLNNQHPQGYYEPSSDYGRLYGRVYSAAMAALSIENAYRVNVMQNR